MMSKMSFTKDQLKAIETSGNNIIVSAGAGSGKTAVLTERVFHKLQHGTKINRLLILTFTKAAASEMKERIRSKMQEDKHLQSELALLDTAYIGTFDSFALSVLKKYGYLKNIRPDVKITESTMITVQKKELLKQIMLEKYEEEESGFLNFIHDFCTKNDREVQKWILKLDSKLDMKEDKLLFLKRYVANFYTLENLKRLANEYEKLVKDELKTITHLLELLKFYTDNDYYEKISKEFSLCLNASDYDTIKENLNIKIPRLPNKSPEEVKSIKDKIKKQLDNVIELCHYKNKAEMKEELLKTKPVVATIISILITLTERMDKFKRDNDLYEFQDVAILSLEIIKENLWVQQELKESFDEIMVDEYQDTNDLQNSFLNLISNHNLYVVGDIKQSIYRFRNANPHNFKEKYDSYKIASNGYKIDLNQNFRSRKEVLEDINFIFNQIMDDIVGEANYKFEHQMIFGNQSYLTDGKTEQNQHMDIVRYKYDKELGYTKEELEAYYIALDIQTKIKEGYQVFDRKQKKMIPITYHDFAILIDRSKTFPLYKKIFEYMGIPIAIEKDESIKSETEIIVLKNLLSLVLSIYNQKWDKKFEYYYVSVARSFIMMIPDDVIFETLVNHQFFHTELFKKAQEIAKVIDYTPTRQVLDLIIEKFDFYDCLIHLGDVEARIMRLESLLDIADSFADLGYDIVRFKEHMDEIMKSELDLKISSPHSDNDAVLVTTIHKSKGLEYPVCYFPELYKKFNIDEMKDKFLYDNEYGISATYFEEGFAQTILKPLLVKKYVQEEISERLRLFYVALTRAREKMIFLTSYDDKMEEARDETGVIDLQVRLQYRSFQDILSSIQDTLNKYYIDVEFTQNDILDNYKFNKEKELPRIEEMVKDYQLKEIEVESKEQTTSHFSKNLTNLISKDESKNLELGLLIHKYLEEIDFKQPEYYLEHMDFFIRQKIENFLNQPLIKNVKINNVNIVKEYEFIYHNEDTEYHGIIDLLLEYDDHIDIIDYKLKDIDDEHYTEQLHGYLEYIKTRKNKPIFLYLYSILQNKMKKID